MAIGATTNAEVDEDELVASAAAIAAELAASDAAVSAEIQISDEDVRIASLRNRLEQDHLVAGPGLPGGLPPYRAASGEELPALESPLFSDPSLHRYLQQSQWNVQDAAIAVRNTLAWRMRVLPSVEESAAVSSGRPQALLEEGRRVRSLGLNRDGDLVVAIDFCWGSFISDDASALDALRMLLLGAEAMIEEADAAGHSQLVVVCFGGPPPCELARALFRCFEKHYPNRLKTAVIYPVPGIFAKVAHACFAFVSIGIRQKILIATQEDEVVEGARLTSALQLPEDWRGGIDAVVEKYKPSYNLLNSMVLRYLNPFQGSQEQLELALDSPWGPVADVPPKRQVSKESRGLLGFLGAVMGADYDE